MPREHFGKEHAFLPRSELLTFEEIARFVRVAAELGVRTVRLTGGEPLLRTELERLVAMLAAIPNLDVALTTNGALLRDKAEALAAAGLRRVTVSLDALDPNVFRENSDSKTEVSDVLAGIEAAERVGLGPIKINAVVRRGVNEREIIPLARYFRGTPHVMRFIEFMDVGITNGWRLDNVVSSSEIVRIISSAFPLEAIPPSRPGEVAKRFVYRDGQGEVGVIASVTEPFCGSCSRFRLSSEGKLYTCLFATAGHDLRALLRSGASDERLSDFTREIWRSREDRYSEARSERTRSLPRIEMSYIGG